MGQTARARHRKGRQGSMADMSIHGGNYVTQQEKATAVWGMRLTTSAPNGVVITVRVGDDTVNFFVTTEQAEKIISGMRSTLDKVYAIDAAASVETETSTEVDGGRDADADDKLNKLGDIARRGGW